MSLPTAEMANEVYDLLVKHLGADEGHREEFVRGQTLHGSHVGEQMIYSDLGCGGKFHTVSDHLFYVDCYTEDLTPRLEAKIRKVNLELVMIRRKHQKTQSL